MYFTTGSMKIVITHKKAKLIILDQKYIDDILKNIQQK